MGIRGLAHILQPYRVSVDFLEQAENLGHEDESRAQESAWQQRVVVDGPTLAYHAYHTAQAQRTHARTALEAMPEYAEVNAVALDMLRCLERHGLVISRIFFDGALPETKRAERLRRLERYMMELQKYRALSTVSAGGTSADVRNPAYDAVRRKVFSATAPLPAKLKTLPATPFLVVSVIDTLLASKYAAVTAVVPGEADIYCAEYLRSTGGMVLTSDSDLLVYDLGPHGSVAFWGDIEKYLSDSDVPLRISRYETASIARQLGFDSLHHLAYAINEDSHRTVNGHLKRARELRDDPTTSYMQFSGQYSTEDLKFVLPASHLASHAVCRLDPRISEWLQGENCAPNPSLIGPPYHDIDMATPFHAVQTSRMYMPVVIEDTTRASAWDASADLRVLAYSLLRPSHREEMSTIEVMRRGNRIAEVQVRHFTDAELGVAFDAFNVLITHYFSQSLPLDLAWSFVAVSQLCNHIMSEGKIMPGRAELKALLFRQRSDDWKLVHWTAQVQGIAYTIRMLHQSMKVFVSLSSRALEFSSCFMSCLSSLNTLPTISGWFDEVAMPDDQSAEAIVKMLYTSLGIEEHAYRPAVADKASTKRSKKRNKLKTESQNGQRIVVPSSNMFGGLAT